MLGISLGWIEVGTCQDEPEIRNESDDESGSNEEMPNLEEWVAV